MNGDIIKIRAAFVAMSYPKDSEHITEDEYDEGFYGVTKWDVQDIVQATRPQGNNSDVGVLDDAIDEQEEIGINPATRNFSVDACNFTKGQVITVTGTVYLPFQSDDVYTLVLKETTHKTYGIQYECMFIGEVVDFSSVANQKSFLSTFMTDLQIQNVYEACENPLAVIAAHDMEELTKTWGIGKTIAESIFNRFEQLKDSCEVFIELDGYGLTPKFIQKLIKNYNSPSKVIQVVKKNPYRLCIDCDGVGFLTADKIAAKSGISANSVKRIEGFVYVYLNTEADSGNSYVYAKDLNNALFDALGSKEELLVKYDKPNELGCVNNIQTAITRLLNKNLIQIIGEDKSPTRKVCLAKVYNTEKETALELRRISCADSHFIYDDWENRVRQQEEKQGWKLTQEQWEAVRACLENQICLITGGAGTGKSSVLACVLKALGCGYGERMRYSFAQCSLSGKAAARMEEVTHLKSSTVHRLLQYSASGFTYNAENPLSTDIIVVDEISLIGGEIFLSLLKAIKSGAKLILLGDMGQLQSIGIMNLAHDLTLSPFIKTIELTKIHRQAQKSGIILLSSDVRNGSDENLRVGEYRMGELQDMLMYMGKKNDNLKQKILDEFTEQYELLQTSGGTIMDIQVLTPLKERGDLSVDALNAELQDIVNPDSGFKHKSLAIGKKNADVTLCKFVLREGDKILCIANNYQAELADAVPNEDGKKQVTEIFNGWTGTITEINITEKYCVIFFPVANRKVKLSTSDIAKYIMLGYACTVHKYQGSQSRYVIGAIDYSVPPTMRTKELLYTMLTRASERCTLVGQLGTVKSMVSVSGIKNKNTFLPDELQRAFGIQEEQIAHRYPK